MSDENIVTVAGSPDAAPEAAPAPVEAPKPEVQAEAPEAETPVTDAESASEGKPEGEADTGEKPEKPRGFMKRIDALTREKHEAKREAERLAAELAAIKAGQQAPAPAVDAPKAPDAPDANKYQGGEFDPMYVAALAAYEARKAVLAEVQQQRAEETRLAEQKSFETRRDALLSKMTDKHEGAEKILSDGNAPMTREMADVILDSPVGVELLDALGRDYAEAARIAALPAAKQGAALAKLEAKLTAPRISAAAPPPPSVAGRARASTSLRDDMSQAEFEAAWVASHKK